MSKTILRHTLIKIIFLTFLLTPYLYTFSLYENPSFIIFSAETEYISTRSWYRNINFLRDRIRRIFSQPLSSSYRILKLYEHGPNKTESELMCSGRIISVSLLAPVDIAINVRENRRGNQETLTTLVTRKHRTKTNKTQKRNITQKSKKMSNTDPT